MKSFPAPSHASLASLASLAALAIALVGCGGGTSAGTTSGLPGQPGQPGQPGEPVVDNGGDAHFDISEVNADRYSATCGVQDPPFAPTDDMTLRAIGTKGKVPLALLTVRLLGSTAVGAPLTLTPDPWMSGETVIGMSQQPGGPVITQTGARDETARDTNSAGSGVQLDLSRGSDATYVDATAFTAVVVTIVALPAKTGDPLTVRVQLTFSDGKKLDQTFSAPMSLSSHGCAAG